MTRALYRGLLWLHPPNFRREFAGEMLWIFDEAAGREGVGSLLVDGLVSVVKQWVLRSGAWKVLAAAVAALCQLLLISRLAPGPRAPAAQTRWVVDAQDFDFSRLLALLFILLAISAVALATAAGTRRRRPK